MTAFLRRLNTWGIGPFWYERVKLSREDGLVDLEAGTFSYGVFGYNLEETTKSLQEAERLVSIKDPTFEKALLYLEHGMLLNERLMPLTERFPEHRLLVHAEAYLNFWKAITLIVGDPARKPPDNVVARCTAIGLPAGFYEAEVKPISLVRHDFDVAHSHLDENRAKEAETKLGQAQVLAQRVIQQYASHLKSGGAPLA